MKCSDNSAPPKIVLQVTTAGCSQEIIQVFTCYFGLLSFRSTGSFE